MKILIINGPNINMLGVREKNIYGKESYKDLVSLVKSYCKENGIKASFKQSNYEGDLVTFIQKAYQKFDGIVINPGAYTHTSIAILDALKAVNIPYVEVHISKVNEREDFRKVSYIRDGAKATITGEGIQGYISAIKVLTKWQLQSILH